MILGTLQKISSGQYIHKGEAVRSCMFFMPPGAAKSTYATVVFPAWYMGRNPESQIILASYASDIARKHGKKARQICGSPEYSSVFGTTLKGDTRAAEEWALDNGSEYMSGGLLSGLTGNRADGLIVDDPVKGRQEAESEATRSSIWEAYTNDADSRLKPKDWWKCVIQTRWHEDDLAGRILPEEWRGESGVIRCRDGELWAVTCLQAECERDDDPLGRKRGELLWPEWFSAEHFRRFKKSPRLWRSLFQQTPTADEGSFFKREWFNAYDKAPQHLNVYMSGDFAVTEGGGDYTELGVWGVAPDKRIYLLDWWYGQTTADVWITEMVERFRFWKPQWFIGESGPIRRAIEPILKRRMFDDNSLCAIEWLPHGQANKEAAARPFQAICSQGLVYFPQNAMAERVKDQLLRFPAGRYVDAVDTCSLFGRFIDMTWSREAPKPKEPEIMLDKVELYVDDFFKPVEQAW